MVGPSNAHRTSRTRSGPLTLFGCKILCAFLALNGQFQIQNNVSVLALIPVSTHRWQVGSYSRFLRHAVPVQMAPSSSTPRSSSSSSSPNRPVNATVDVSDPLTIHKDKFETKMKEMRDKDRIGDKITQAYCDSVLGLCVSSDEWDSVLEVLDIMKRQGLVQERSSYRACLQACFEVGNGASAKEILTAMEQALVKPEPADISLVVGAMCRNNKSQAGLWKQAFALLQSTAAEITDGDGDKDKQVVPVEAYDAILSCMVEERQWKQAVQVLRLMEEGSNPKPGGSHRHPKPELSTYRSVLECCVAASQPEQAVQVLYSMKNHGLQPTVYAFELVISALCRKVMWRRAVQLLDLMGHMNIPKTVGTYNTVISACARAREVGMAKSLMAKMRKEGVRPNVITFNSVISACASTSRWKEALEVVDQCHREPGVSPDIYTYTNAMRACARGGKTSRALTLLQVVKDKKLPLDSYCYTAVIDACAKAKMWKRALELLDEMQENNIAPTEVTYSVAISACGNGGQWKKALGLLQLMREKGMKANLITYNNAITALSKASRQRARNSARMNYGTSIHTDGDYTEFSDEEGLWTRVMLLIQQMKEDGIEPDGFSLSSAISCCGAEGRWQEALELIKVMKKGGPKTRPNKISYTAAISACGRAGESKEALKLFRNMKDEGLSPDSIAYNAMFSALRVAGEADAAYELWEEICGTRSTNTGVIATAKDIATPDIITVTDCIAALSRGNHLDQLDEVFAEAVKRGIVLRGLDIQWETDLSGMSFPVARAACRYIIQQARGVAETSKDDLRDVIMITGVGRAHQTLRQRKQTGSDASSNGEQIKESRLDAPRSTSLRDYVQEILREDFKTPIESDIPKFAQGTVEVSKRSLLSWAEKQALQ